MSNQQLDEEAIFHIARKLDNPTDRDKYFDQVCDGDPHLRERVEALLEVHEQEQDFLRSSPDGAPTANHSPITEAPGQQVGRYKLLQKIGEGGFGVVFMAEQTRPIRRKVALKIIKPGMDTKEVIARLEAERQALALMDHPNIARVLDGGATDSGRPYFVMELVNGLPITEYCNKNRLSTDGRLKLFTTVCESIQHAHRKGIIHRDLKPSNVLVTLADGQPIVKVIDFGVVKAINQKLTEKTLITAFGQMVGTPQYMSPEQAEMSCLDVDIVHHVAMLNSSGIDRDYHQKRGLAAAQHKTRSSLGELSRAQLYQYLGDDKSARRSFLAAARLGDTAAYHVAPFLFYTTSSTALSEFRKLQLKNPAGPGALGAEAFLLALTSGHQHEAIELADRVAQKNIA